MAQPARYHVCGIGNALLDYQVEVSHQTLLDLKVTPASMTLVDAGTQTEILERIAGTHRTKKSSGGSVANSIAGIANFGGRTFFVGRLSDDLHGREYVADLRRENIDHDIKLAPSGTTGTCLALITPDGERTMLTHLGIAVELSEADVPMKAIRESDVAFIEGYLWDSLSARAACQKAAHEARQAGRKVAFTYSDSFCVDRHKADFIRFAKESVDVLFCNHAEAMKATGATSISAALAALRDFSDTVCVTLGKDGAWLSRKSTTEQVHVPTWDVKVIDKLGAGDLFAAGVLHGLTQGLSLKECGSLGNFSATQVIQQMGARLENRLSARLSEALRGPALNERVASELAI